MSLTILPEPEVDTPLKYDGDDQEWCALDPFDHTKGLCGSAIVETSDAIPQLEVPTELICKDCKEIITLRHKK